MWDKLHLKLQQCLYIVDNLKETELWLFSLSDMFFIQAWYTCKSEHTLMKKTDAVLFSLY